MSYVVCVWNAPNQSLSAHTKQSNTLTAFELIWNAQEWIVRDLQCLFTCWVGEQEFDTKLNAAALLSFDSSGSVQLVG
jgi:hypothetical protein